MVAKALALQASPARPPSITTVATDGPTAWDLWKKTAEGDVWRCFAQTSTMRLSVAVDARGSIQCRVTPYTTRCPHKGLRPTCLYGATRE